jgi:RNA polymerase sigma-70 factor (ECF subfamily)
MTDPELLTHWLNATARGDRAAFQALYRAASPHLFALLLRMLKRRDLAEEALQDCFVRIWQKADTYAPARGAPLTWLMSIARYRALDLIRRQRPEVSLDDEESGIDLDTFQSEAAEASPDPLQASISGESLAALNECLEILQDQQRRSVLLAYYEGYTHEELAQHLDKPLGTVKSWVRRGLQRLRECLESP